MGNALLWEKVCHRQIHQICSKNKLDMNKINGHAWMGLGIASNPFTDEEPVTVDLAAYLLWMAKNTDGSYEVIIPDTLQRTNYESIYNLDKHHAEKYARELGKQKEEAVETLAFAFSLNLPVTPMECMDDRERFNDICSKLKEIREKDPYIDNTFLSLVPKSIRTKIKEWQLIRLFDGDNKEKILYLFSSEVDKTKFADALKGYTDANKTSINIGLTVEDVTALQKGEGASVTKQAGGKTYAIKNEDGKLNIYKIPENIKEGYSRSQNKLKYLEAHLKKVCKSNKERRSIHKELQKDFKMRVREVSCYALEEVALIFTVDGVKIGHRNEWKYDRLTTDIYRAYGEEYGLRKIDKDSFRYLPPSAMGPIEPYGVRKGKGLFTTDTSAQIKEKVQHIPVWRLRFIREMLVELNADPEGVIKGKIDKAKIGALIHDLLVEPIRDAKLAIRIMEDQKERRLYTTMEKCKIKEDETILYIGQSWGRLPDLIAKKAGSISVLASKERVDKYSSLPSEEDSRITFKLLDKKWLTGEEKLPFPDCSFDVVLFSNLPHNQFPHDEEKQKAFLLDAFRLVKPGGKIVAVEPYLDPQFMEEPVRSYLKERVFVVTDWPNKFGVLVRDGIVNEKALWTGILPGVSPHLFHSKIAAIAYLSGNTPEKSHFYNLGPLSSKETGKVRELVEQLPLGNDGFRTIFDGITMTDVRKPFSTGSDGTNPT